MMAGPRRALAIALLLTVLGGGPAFGQARSDDTPGENLGGYDGIASGSALSFQPFLPALLSTGDVPVEATFALSSSRVRSGGNAFGRAALAWPGSTAADLGPVLGVAFGQEALGALIPKWPLQASATQDDGRVVTGAEPIAAMTAFGGPDRAEGDTRIADVHVPRVVQIDHVTSTSSSIVTDTGVNATSIVKLQGVSLLAGHIKIEEIRSISRTASIGGAASSSGDVDVIGMKIGGVDVSVTDDGFEVSGLPPQGEAAPGAGGEPFPGISPEDIVNTVLATLGARITLFESFARVQGGQAERMQPGLVLSVDNPIGGTGPIPPGRFDIFLATTSSSALGSLPFSAGAGVDVPDMVGGGGGGGSSASRGPTPTDSLGGGADVGTGSVDGIADDLDDAAVGSLGAVGSLEGAEAAGEEYRFAGLPLGLVLGLLLLALLLARYLRDAVNGLLASGAGDDEGDE